MEGVKENQIDRFSGGSLQICLYGVCGHTIGKLTHPQTKVGPTISRFRIDFDNYSHKSDRASKQGVIESVFPLKHLSKN